MDRLPDGELVLDDEDGQLIEGLVLYAREAGLLPMSEVVPVRVYLECGDTARLGGKLSYIRALDFGELAGRPAALIEVVNLQVVEGEQAVCDRQLHCLTYDERGRVMARSLERQGLIDAMRRRCRDGEVLEAMLSRS